MSRVCLAGAVVLTVWMRTPATAAGADNLKDAVSQIPVSVASTEDEFWARPMASADGAPEVSRAVVLVHDAHTSESGQLNIAHIIERLLPWMDSRNVYLEAATGDASMTFLRSKVKHDLAVSVGRRYLQKGLLHGSEYANLVADVPFTLWGVEKQDLYEQSILKYRMLIRYRERAREHLDEAGRTLRLLRTRAISLGAEELQSLEIAERKIAELRRLLDEPFLPGRFKDCFDAVGPTYFMDIAGRLNRIIRDKGLSLTTAYLTEVAFQRIQEELDSYDVLVHERDREFVQRMFERMDASGENTAILIAGSSHIANLSSILKNHNVSYVCLKPAVYEPTDFRIYEDLLMSQSLSADSVPEMPFRETGAADHPLILNTVMLRPLMAQVPFDVFAGKKPLITEFGRDLGRPAESAVHSAISVILKVLQGDVMGELPVREIQPDEGTFEKFMNFLRSPFTEIYRNQDLESYLAFKQHCEDFQLLKSEKKNVAPEEVHGLVEASIRQYEGSLALAVRADRRERYVLMRLLKRWMLEPDVLKQGLAWGSFLARMAASPDLRRMITDALGQPEAPAAERPAPPAFRVNSSVDEATVKFLARNLTAGGMPLSYDAPDGYWDLPENNMSDLIDGILERQIVEYSVNIYDAATWQIALSLTGDPAYRDIIDDFTLRLVSGASGNLRQIKAAADPFRYGDEQLELAEENAFFFRIISDEYLQKDPKNNMTWHPEFPNFELLHHEDWKPITGAQAWAAVIGPLQTAYLKYGGHVPADCEEMKLPLQILPAIEAMVSPPGAIYHCPWGTHGKDPHDISNENNFSMLSGLRMLRQVLEEQGDAPRLQRVERLIQALENYFRYFAFNYEDGVFYQGGFFVEGEFIPTKIFAVDCQTWGTVVLGPEWIDGVYGEGTAYRIWKNTKRRAGFFDENGIIEGVGFTDSHRVNSVEWTAGAIEATRMAGEFYRESHPEWSKELLEDSLWMRHGIEKLKTDLEGGETAYFYASDRFFIPFGWWANRIPSLVSSAWVVMLNRGFNPFVLGGGERYTPDPNLWSAGLRKALPAEESSVAAVEPALELEFEPEFELEAETELEPEPQDPPLAWSDPAPPKIAGQDRFNRYALMIEPVSSDAQCAELLVRLVTSSGQAFELVVKPPDSGPVSRVITDSEIKAVAGGNFTLDRMEFFEVVDGRRETPASVKVRVVMDLSQGAA
ncbi:MAG: hypothetical protein HQL11_02890 [Candidatus Omnitrophica bacterium]|nr:hypothetical protein [Candidatus Omnitrophota bacterium]